MIQILIKNLTLTNQQHKTLNNRYELCLSFMFLVYSSYLSLLLLLIRKTYYLFYYYIKHIYLLFCLNISIFFFSLHFTNLRIFLHQNFNSQKEADLIIEHQKLSNTQSVLMQHAIANSVRLCVVAPTVNVHIADEIHKLQSG